MHYLIHLGDHLSGHHFRDESLRYTMAMNTSVLARFLVPPPFSKRHAIKLQTIDFKHTIVYGELKTIPFFNTAKKPPEISVHMRSAYVSGAGNALASWLKNIQRFSLIGACLHSGNILIPRTVREFNFGNFR